MGDDATDVQSLEAVFGWRASLREARTLEEAKELASIVLADLGLATHALSWRASEHSISPWAYLELDIGGWRPLSIGASAGGVVAVNHHPFTPEGAINVTYGRVRQSIETACSAILKPVKRHADTAEPGV